MELLPETVRTLWIPGLHHGEQDGPGHRWTLSEPSLGAYYYLDLKYIP